MAWIAKALAVILALVVLIGGIFLSIILFINLRNTERDNAQRQLDLECDLLAGYTSSLLWGTVTLMIALVEMIKRGGWIGQERMQEILSQMTALPWPAIGMAELQLIPGSNITAWQNDYHANVTTVDPNTFKQVSEPLDRPWYLPLTSCVPCQAAIGLDYFGEYFRAELVQRSVRKKGSAVSYPIQTSTVTHSGQTVRALVFFTPYFNESNRNAFEGGVSSSYDSAMLLNRNNTDGLSFAMTVLNTTVFEDPDYAGTALKHNSTFLILDQPLILSCGTGFSGSLTPWIVFFLGIFLSLLVPAVIFFSIFSMRKQRASNLRAMTAHEAQQAALVREQAALSLGELKSSFLATMSHEIRTPINGIIGMVDLLLDLDLNERQKDYAETIRESALSLLSIINDILDFSKLQAGKVVLESIDTDLSKLLATLQKTTIPLARVNDNEFVVNPADYVIKTDPNRLKQVVNNLLSNAFKFTKNGKVTLQVTKERGKLHDGTYSDLLHFSIADTGIGMSPQVLGKLFKAFSQADASTTRKYGGTGLGLVISKELVNLLNGDIWAESEVGKGSIFHFTVPFVQGSLTDVVEDVVYPGTGLILAVDDNPTNLKVAVGLLRKLGYTVVTARNGEEAITTYEANRSEIKAILMDCQMPILDGYGATRKMRALGYQVPIIAMTASVMPEEIEACYTSGMNDYVTKPMYLPLLSAILKKYTEQ